jgi:hypothetical protein
LSPREAHLEVMADDLALRPGIEEEEDDFFFMANLFPKTTGLSHAIWLSERANSRQDVRVKVSTATGGRADPRNMAVMSVRPEPRLLHGSLPADVVREVGEWIALNEPVILAYWNGELDTADLGPQLRKLDC